MNTWPASLQSHRVAADDVASVTVGDVVFSPAKAAWLAGMALAALVGGMLTFTALHVAVFLVSTGTVLLLGH
ncbi:hypothetical protein ABTO64_18840, partial [Acinetobacter baumannii]